MSYYGSRWVRWPSRWSRWKRTNIYEKTIGYVEDSNKYIRRFYGCTFDEQVCNTRSNPTKPTLKAAVTIALQSAADEPTFKKQFAEQGINVVVRRNDTGRIYGITFIDHNSKTVWNGSCLGKELSANTFNDYLNNNIKPDIKEPDEPKAKISHSQNKEDLPAEKPHPMFDITNTDKKEAFGGLLPDAQGEDYEEQDFANRMKKKQKRRKRQ